MRQPIIRLVVFCIAMSLEQKFIWNELRVPDLDLANAFYGPLFGWITKPEERSTYVHFYQGEDAVAGFMAPLGGSGAPSHWHVHVGTSDVDAYVERAKEAGGKALMPTLDIPHTGKMSAIEDPGGAVLAPFQVADPERPSWGHKAKAGNFCWVELLCQDEVVAKAFYSKVVGWELIEAGTSNIQYCLLTPPGAAPEEVQGGIMKMNNPEVSDNWLPYVCVDNVEAAAAKAVELGGTICVPPGNLATQARFAVLIDTQGAVFGIYQSLAGEG
jgi:predicted enzyme related to lactoylglutathione lyase